jgi:prevent-host-death family protein
MKRVKLSELKAHLSEYVAAARRGETVIVCDRDTPVAKLEPFASNEAVDGGLNELPFLAATKSLAADSNDDWIQEPNLTEEERREILSNIKPVALLKDVDVHALFDELRADRY